MAHISGIIKGLFIYNKLLKYFVFNFLCPDQKEAAKISIPTDRMSGQLHRLAAISFSYIRAQQY
jgi:hypothetical protein